MLQIYKIKDFFNRELGRDSNGYIAPKQYKESFSDIFLFICPHNKNICYIVSDDKQELSCGMDPFKWYVYSFGISYFDDKHIALSSIENGNFLTSTDTFQIIDNAKYIREWELFTLEAVSNIQNDYVLITFESICKFHIRYKELEKVFSYREKMSLVPGLLSSVRALELSILKNICKYIMQDREWVEAICEYDKSIWGSLGLKALIQYINNKSDFTYNNIVDQKFDFLANEIVPPLGVDAARPVSPLEIILRTIRANVIPSKDFCILATARNEGIYLAEWIAYHKSIGFDGFFIYINDCQDNSKKILSEFQKNNIVKYYESFSQDGVNVQGKAYGHALTFVPEILDYRWVLIIDLDELFVFDKNRFNNLKDYFEYIEKKQVDSIAFDWINMGSNKQIEWCDVPYFERFSNEGFHESHKIKTAFRPHKAARSYPHFPIEFNNYSFIRRNSIGNLMVTRVNEEIHGPHGKHVNDNPDPRFAVIYHYYFKSVEEFIWKSSRNRGDHPKSEKILDIAFNEDIAQAYIESFENENNETADILSFPRINKFAENFYLTYEKIISIPEIKYELAENHKFYRERFLLLLKDLRNNSGNMGSKQKYILDMLSHL